jgi:hypothetical protein
MDRATLIVAIKDAATPTAIRFPKIFFEVDTRYAERAAFSSRPHLRLLRKTAAQIRS